MNRPLTGIKVVEVAMWAFVPSCGAVLSDLGADVIKVEPPNGDPMRGLTIGGMNRQGGIDLSWEAYNRGKRSLTLDLKLPEALAVLHKLLADADVFLTNLLPPARRKMQIDEQSIRAQFPKLIYATGSGLGPNGPEANKGGFDGITYWARGAVAAALMEEDADFPPSPPGPAFGDCMSGGLLAGAISAALAGRALTGEAATVDVSLLGAAMWQMQRFITQSTMDQVQRFPRPVRDKPFNPLVNPYRTADGRFVSLCMLQSDRYWAPLCHCVGRPDLADDPRFVNDAARRQNLDACVAELKALFASRPLAEWQEILLEQDGQWEPIKYVGELHADPQVQANNYLQTVRAANGRDMPMVSIPMQFNNAAFSATHAPELGQHSDEILTSLGYTEDEIIDLRVAGAVL